MGAAGLLRQTGQARTFIGEIIVRTLILTVAAVSFLATAVNAHPQYENYRWNNRADECREAKREGRQNGALIGAMLGAAIGGAASDSSEGAILGGVAGAVIGSDVGRRSAKRSSSCDQHGPYWYYRDTHDARYYDRRYGFDNGHHHSRRDSRYDRVCRDPRWAYDRHRTPVRVCADRNGIYRPY